MSSYESKTGHLLRPRRRSQERRYSAAAAATAAREDDNHNDNASGGGAGDGAGSSGGAKSQFRPPHRGMTPLELYQMRLDGGELHIDQQQEALIKDLDRLHGQLRNYEAHPPTSDSMDVFLK